MKTCKRCKIEQDESEFRTIRNRYWNSGKLVPTTPFIDKVCISCRRVEYHEAHIDRETRLAQWRKENGL